MSGEKTAITSAKCSPKSQPNKVYADARCGTTALQSALSLALALAAACASGATPPGLVGWWRAEGNANDSAGANPGIPEGGLAYSPGEVGLAFSFNGTDADVRIPASDALDVGEGSGMSVEAWIKPADVAARHPFFEWNDGAFGTTIGLSGSLMEGGAGPGAFVANFKDLDYQGHVINSSPGVLTTNRFQHVAATYDRGSGDAKLYVDGAIAARANLGIFTPRTIGDLYFGLRPYDAGAGLRYAGEMDEVSVYNRALSASEVQAIYHAGEAGKAAVRNPPFIVSRPSPRAMQPSEPAELPAGILEEDLNLDLNAAIQSYQSLINQFDAQRPMAANAVFRMAECYRRLGRMDEARSQYARILREFADQAPLVKLSGKYANPALATAQMPADGASSGPHPADETATLEWQLAQARNELLKAKSQLVKGPFRPGRMGPEQAELDLAKLQETLWSSEVARLEAHLKDQEQRRTRQEAAARLKYEQAEAEFKRVDALSKTHAVSNRDYEAAKLALAQAAAEYPGPAESGVAGPEARVKGQVQRSLGKVYVTGMVHQPGAQEIPDDEVFTVSKAILKAGGFSDFADNRHVRLIRSGRQDQDPANNQTPPAAPTTSPSPGARQGQDSTNRRAMIINVAEILEKGETGNDIPVQADDLIYVPKRNVNF